MIHCSYKYKICFWLVVENISSSMKEGRVIVNVVAKRFVLFSLSANIPKDIFCLFKLIRPNYTRNVHCSIFSHLPQQTNKVLDTRSRLGLSCHLLPGLLVG